MTIIPRIEFGTDGIRGKAGEYPLDPFTVLQIGRAIGKYAKSRTPLAKVVIGRDTRISGGVLISSLSTGLLLEGVNVADYDVISTPGVAYETRITGADLGIVVTASHNPFDQNGIKVFGRDGYKLPDDDEDAIEQLLEQLLEEASNRPHLNGTSLTVENTLGKRAVIKESPAYVESLKHGIQNPLRIRVVLDTAYGAGYEIAPIVFRALDAEVIVLNSEDPSGYNINVETGSEHVRRDRSALLDAILKNNADVGIALDGDADRVVFVTPEGTLIDGDHVLGILAVEMKREGKLHGDSVVATEMSNSGLEDYLKAHGIGLSRTKVGDRYVMDRLREKGYTLGGEQAGHIILLDEDHTCGDGIYIGLRVVDIVARNKHQGGPTLHTLASTIPRYPQVIASAHLSAKIDLNKITDLASLQQKTLDLFGRGKGSAGRVNMRFSGTEPNLLRVMVEGGAETARDEVIAAALALVEPVSKATNSQHPRIDLVDCATGEPI